MIKGKILKITENTVYIGYEDGSLKEIPIESCDFEPSMGDYVEVYGDIAIKVEDSKESTPVKKHKSRKSKIKPILIALVVIVLSVSAYFIMNKVTTSQNISSSSKSSTSSSKNSSSSSSQESSSSSTKSSISGKIPKNLLTIDYEERMDKQKYTSSFDYDKWAHDEFPRYLKIRVSGEVLQVAKDPDDKGILIQLVLNELNSGYGKSIVVFIPSDYLSGIIVEGDKLELYGKTYGVNQYVVDDSVVIQPFMIAYLYERDK
ncbi:hypothetical protein ACTRTA_01745 [Streptococcus pneumoniae]|nr:hypothetical protein [Streptococcus pneumoniae]MDG7765335.1 hypothetical protein [Streptococcus pneumoniae]MDG8079406.1 hypothetical protein [Streptococcus pneumoniae]MDG8385655.1 hypothetical protein [Streptococcus pneumoniae]MDG8568040.1 hypothetical protein [Streptococcus pneumoniae]